MLLTYSKHHALVLYLTLGPNVKAEGPILVFFVHIIPVKCANANLECNKFIDIGAQLLITGFNSIIVINFVVGMSCIARKFTIN